MSDCICISFKRGGKEHSFSAHGDFSFPEQRLARGRLCPQCGCRWSGWTVDFVNISEIECLCDAETMIIIGINSELGKSARRSVQKEIRERNRLLNRTCHQCLKSVAGRQR